MLIEGGYVLGVCNGFQVLTEMGVLPGSLLRNAGLKYICKMTSLEIKTSNSIYTSDYRTGDVVDLPIAHHDGNYFADQKTLDKLTGDDRIALSYVDNPNGSKLNIAGILSANRRILGMMPHPERAADSVHGGTDGQSLFRGMASALAKV